MTAQEATRKPRLFFPATPLPEGENDLRWQAIIAVAEFIESEPEAVWSFALRWGSSNDEDLRAAIAACVLEHLLEHHFDLLISRVEEAALGNQFFARTVTACWKFGQSEEPRRAARLDRLQRSLTKTGY